MTKTTWFAKLDDYFYDMCGLSHSDVPDYMWWDLYADGATPKQAFQDWQDDPVYGMKSL